MIRQIEKNKDFFKFKWNIFIYKLFIIQFKFKEWKAKMKIFLKKYLIKKTKL